MPCTSSLVLTNTADTVLELLGGGQRIEQLNPVSPGVMGGGCMDLLLIPPLEESSHGSLINLLRRVATHRTARSGC